MMRRRLILAAALAALAALSQAAVAWHAATPPAYDGVPAFGNVFVLVGENTSLSQLNAKDTPFQTGTVRPNSAWFTNFFGTTHWSLANYVAMTSGQFNDCQRDDLGPADCHQNVDNLFHQLDVAGISWQEWMESMPEPCTLESSGLSKDGNSYRVKHNPAIYYDNIEGAGGVWSASQPFGRVPAKRRAGRRHRLQRHEPVQPGAARRARSPASTTSCPTSARTPTTTASRPATCSGSSTTSSPARWRAIEASPAWTASSVIVIVYDEGQKGGPGNGERFAGGNTPFAVISPMVHPATYTQLNDHYGFLRTMEDGFRLPTYLGGAAGADPLNQIWK